MIKILHFITDNNVGGAGKLLCSQIKNMGGKEFKITVALPQSSQLKKPLSALPCALIDLRHGADKSFYAPSILEAAKIIKSEQPDIVHSHGSLSSRIAATLDGEAINSCLYLAVWIEGKEVRTLEGLLGPNGELHAIQEAFIEEAAIQCGFCTPGFIMTAVEIIESGKKYTDDELRKLLSGHLCRCTGYENILRAVKKAIKRVMYAE